MCVQRGAAKELPSEGVTMKPGAAHGSKSRRFAAIARRRCDFPRMVRRRSFWCPLTAVLMMWMTTTTVTGDEVKVFQPRLREPLRSEECPASCRDVFSKLEWGPSPRGGGAYVQKLEVQERGGMCVGSAGCLLLPCISHQNSPNKSPIDFIPPHSSRWVRLFGSLSSASIGDPRHA